MANLTMEAVERRHNYLKKVYNENDSTSFNLKKYELKTRAKRLMYELRERYGFKNEWRVVDQSNLTPEMVSGNGKYSLD